MVEIALIYPLISAGAFATSSVMIRDLDRIASPLLLNFFRTAIGGVIFLSLLLIFNSINELFQLTFIIIVFLILSVIFNVVIGDTLFFKAQTVIGVKTATPIVNIFPFITIILSVIFLGESFGSTFLFGGTLIIMGVMVLSQDVESGNNNSTIFEKREIIVAFIFTAVVVTSYALGVFFTTLGSKNLDPIVANSIRLPAAAVILALILLQQSRLNNNNPKDQTQRKLEYNDKLAFRILLVGFLGTYIASLFLIVSVQILGAGKTAVLTSTGPIFALPLAYFWLKEEFGWKTLIGASISLIGIWIILI